MDLVEGICLTYLNLKVKDGKLEQISFTDAANTIRRVLELYGSDKNSILLKEFLVDLRNLANKEGYALCEIGVDGNPTIDLVGLREYLGI